MFWSFTPTCRRTIAMELVDYLKANPGKLEYGYGNSGGLISGELLRRAAGVEMARVAYRSNRAGSDRSDLGAHPQ